MGLSASQTRPVWSIVNNELAAKQAEQLKPHKTEEVTTPQLRSEKIEDKASISEEALALLNNEKN